MDPYRTLAVDEVPEAPRDPGLVGDVIRQFADPKAFFRELVQNSIDAGSPSVDIRIEYDPPAQKLRVAVRDRGVGMSRDTLENQLLVLFRSTKESDPTKIGKFGIGFASVLAPSPEVVIVQSVHDGRRLTLHLYRDLTYELFDGGTATQPGTTVELVLAMDDASVEPFVRASVEALLRWCRHASVPIELVWVPPAGPAQTTRIDRPLVFDNAIVQVVERSTDGHLTAVVGILNDLEMYTGFFNHGLMLHETSDLVVARSLAVKIQDSRLGHTLSRDNVRRDEAYERAVSFARSIAARQLPRAIEAELRAAADAGTHSRYRLLGLAAILTNTVIEWRLPLADPIGETRSIAASDLPRRAWTSESGSRLAALVAGGKRPVVHTVVGEVNGLLALLDERYGCRLTPLHDELTAIVPIAPAPADTALLALLREMLAAAGKAPSSIVLATLEGARSDAFVIAGERRDDNEAYVLDRTDTEHSPFSRLRRPPLVISVEHGFYRRARVGDPRLAASHLARAILLEYEQLDAGVSQRLLDHTLSVLA